MLENSDLDRAVAVREVIFIRKGLSKFFSTSDLSADFIFIRLLGGQFTD